MSSLFSPAASAQKTVLITQSNYIPWKGYFGLIDSVDELVLLDSVQYTRRDWRNRNIIKTPSGPIWLTIPVNVKGRYHQAIDEVNVSDLAWADKHVRTLQSSYKRAGSYDAVSPWLFESIIAVAKATDKLSAINEYLIRAISSKLGISTPIKRCTEILEREAMLQMDPTERLVEICRALGATRYVSGPAAKDYLDVAKFHAHKIDVVWADYGGYREYPQLWGAFDHSVSIVDLLLNAGDASRELMLLPSCRRVA